MTNEFTREARYAVLKSADVLQCLTVSELIELRRIQAKVGEHRAEIGAPPLECVVVESDWPEYEPTWKAIEARVTGAQPVSSVPDDMVERAVNSFLSWKLPKDFHPDGGIVFIPTKGRGYDSPYWPCGTNLLNAQQARGMLRHVLAAAPEAKP